MLCVAVCCCVLMLRVSVLFSSVDIREVYIGMRWVSLSNACVGCAVRYAMCVWRDHTPQTLEYCHCPLCDKPVKQTARKAAVASAEARERILPCHGTCHSIMPSLHRLWAHAFAGLRDATCR